MTSPFNLLGLEITDRCDLACAHCLRQIVPASSPRARDIDLGVIRRLAVEARELGITHVGITGGEPMLHPQFVEIIDTLVDQGLVYNFLSNGLGLPRLLPSLMTRPERRAQLREVNVSVDGATEETHERHRGRGSFKKTLAGIAVLRAMRLPFSIVTTITRVNHHEIDQMGLLAHHLGAERILFTHFMPNGRPYATQDLDLTTEERFAAEAVIKRLIHAMRFEILVAEGYYVAAVDHECPIVRLRSLNVDPSGHMTFCCELSNFNGDDRPPETRSDWIADMATTSLREACDRQIAAVANFRRERLAEAAAGQYTEDDHFACRYCVRHFGKPKGETFVPLRLRRQ